VGFDHLARPYRCLERLVFGGLLQRARCVHLERFHSAERVLLLGDGDGRFLEALLESGVGAEIVSVDASAEMLKLSRARAGTAADRVRFVHSDIFDFEPPPGFRPNLVAAHFFFDCFAESEIAALLDRVSGWMAPEGVMVVTDFALPEGGFWRRMWGRVLIWKMVTFFRLAAGISAPRLPDLDRLLRAAGWRRGAVVPFRRGFVRSEKWACPWRERS
jgi:SAM-dependent methyltransferase